jgi:glycosyltransferase involved in cell wall biosynthesis
MVETVMLATPRWTRDGGVGAHAQASATVLADHGLHVRVLTARVEYGGRQEAQPGITVHHAPRLFDMTASGEERLAGALSPAPDVVHLHQIDDPVLLAALRERAPVVISAHAYTACTSGVHYFRPGHECTRAHGPACVANLALRGCAHTRHPKTLPAKYRHAGLGLAALRSADLAIAYSRAVDRHLAANGIAQRRIVPLFPTLAPAIGSGHADRRRVVFAGRISAPKGVDVLLRAAREIDAEFVICGDGRRLDAMRRLTRRLRIERRVAFKGWLGATELAQALADASVVAIPSRWPEPFGLVGIEALAAGRPVVASFAGGVSDWLQDGVSGVGVPPGDPHALAQALERLLGDPQRQHTMGAAGRETVAARFSPERHVEALLEGYEAARSRWTARGHYAATAG